MAATALEPRKTAKQARARHSCDALVEATAQLLATSDNPSTNAIAARAGVSIGTLYQYFPNKDALVAAAVRRAQDARQQALRDRAGGGEMPLADTVRALIKAAVDQDRADPALALAIDRAEARLPVGNALDGAAAVIAEVLTAHGWPAERIAAAARTLPGAVRATIDAWTAATPPDFDRAEAEAVRLALAYLGLETHRC